MKLCCSDNHYTTAPLNGKCSGLNDFCYAEFLANYTLENKSSSSCEYQSNELDDSLIEKNHEETSYSKQIKLMISGERMQCFKVRRILRYHVPNKILLPEKFAHHVLLLFYPFRDEKELYQVSHHCIKINCMEMETRIL